MVFLQLLRPAQWSKNLLLLIALIFSRKVSDPVAVRQELLAILSFCLAASGVYAFNDVLDRKHDAKHPKNKYRPIASGAILPVTGVGIALALWAIAVAIGSRLPAEYLAILLCYVANGIAYCLAMKRMVILDVLSIVFGFFLRVMAGGAAIGVAISHWLIVCSLSFSLLLAFCKRRAELVRGAEYKAVLDEYSKPLIEQMVSVSAGMAIISYLLYTVSDDTIAKFGTDRLIFTVPFVLYGVFRYLYLAYKSGFGENPAEALLRDRAMFLNGAGYLLTVFWVLYFPRA